MSRLGEDIRHAKAIYELAHGEQDNNNVKEWLSFAKYAVIKFKLKSYQELTTLLNLKAKTLTT